MWCQRLSLDACLGCGKSDKPPHGHGYCSKCHEKKRYREKGLYTPKWASCEVCKGSGRVRFDLLGKTYSHACFTCRGVPRV